MLLLVGCGFQGDAGALGSGSGTGDSGPLPPDGSAQPKGRRITATIAAGRVNEDLRDFPVYVELSHDELKTKLDVSQMSFRQRGPTSVTNLAYEVQSFDKGAGRLAAWVRLPLVSSAAATTFELQYGDPSVAVAATPNAVWSNHYVAVFHLESKDAPIVDSRRAEVGTPTGLPGGALVSGQMGRGIDFDDVNAAVISFPNPISGAGASTISAWVDEKSNSGDKDTIVVLGSGTAGAARAMYAEFDNNQIGVDFFGGDWHNTGESVENSGWKLVHWTYDTASRLYIDGMLEAGPHTHTQAPDTTGTGAWIGNVKSGGFDQNSALDGALDEVRISDVARSAGWVSAEFANQKAPTSFVDVSPPQALP